MENSSNSSITNNSNIISSNQTLIDHDDCSCDQEESSWTPYFDHLDSQNKYINNNNDIIEQQQHHSTSYLSCSTFSYPNTRDNCFVGFTQGPSLPNTNPKNLKSTRAKEISCLDDSLEDTAISPNRTPKVTYFNQLDMNHMKTDDFGYNSLGKGDSFGHQQSKLQTKGENQMKNFEFQDLKKKGLCLVPISMLVDYLG